MDAACETLEVFASEYILQFKFNLRGRHLIPVDICGLKLRCPLLSAIIKSYL